MVMLVELQVQVLVAVTIEEAAVAALVILEQDLMEVLVMDMVVLVFNFQQHSKIQNQQ